MAFLNDAEKAALTEKIRETEAGTSGEIVAVITHSSDDYTYIPLLWATLIALSVPGIYFLLEKFGHFSWQLDADRAELMRWVYLVQGAIFFLLASLFQWDPLKIKLIPKRVKHFRAANQARNQFITQNVHWTEHRAGILIFVSVAEHYVEILVDQSLAEKVDDSYWQASIDRFVSDVRAGATASGFNKAIDDCRDQLWKHFPHTRPETQTLPDHLIEV